MIKKEEKKQGKWISFHNHCELMLHMYQYRNLSFEITKVAEEEKVAAGRSEQSNHGWWRSGDKHSVKEMTLPTS